ncbi:ADAMTS-like protein 3 [Pristis pectinata]|uniref:ADAMTS-like protein 3 n=1 Tax=Pristis pectinata TaxID=685728 RepID=UPI00223E4DA4|nr:ADAMTS-like protein 3 [Pristis pectinata]XP_051896609.1 ADAMTS-like protein 3 [Pristis pectinata]
MRIFEQIRVCALITCVLPAVQGNGEQSQTIYFLPEFALSPQGSFLEDTTGEQVLTYRYDDQTSRITRSDEDKDSGWDAWGTWSDCSRTCGGGASYSLRRCLNGRRCEGRNIRYKTCSNVDCPPDAGDFRHQQCSAHNDVKYQGQYYEWIPIYNDPEAQCALKCQARGTTLIVELSPKVLDGTRCNTESLNMCISGICQVVGCDRQLGSKAKEDNCGVCAGSGSTCRLVRGQSKSHASPEKLEDTVIAVPYGSRHVKITVKGPAHLYIESKTLQGHKGEHNLSASGVSVIENTTVEFQKGSDKEVLKMQGPLGADFIIKTRYVSSRDSVVQFMFYQPISHQWRETDFYPCTVTCGGGYQLSSAECVDIRSGRVVPEHSCNYYPENKKPKPKLQECNMDHCPSSDGFKQLAIYDHFQPLPRWESSPWTACSVFCGGGIQTRSVPCIEENMYGEIIPVEEWKCMYTFKPPVIQNCNLFDCPKWIAMEWSPCTVTCGRGLRYRVVLCIDYRGQHTGGCNAQLKPHIKEECTVPIPCYKTKEKLPMEAKVPWIKQAQEMLEPIAVSEEPKFIPEPWSQCSTSCGTGKQVRRVTCRVLLSFSQTEEELPDEECEEDKPPTEQTCYLAPCDGVTAARDSEVAGNNHDENEMEEQFDWEYEGFTPCTASCLRGEQETIVVCRNKHTQESVDESLCDNFKRPPHMVRVCGTEPCPARWGTRLWKQCSATCGVGIQAREVYCRRTVSHPVEDSIRVPDEECTDPKPPEVQACNQFDCPPSWHKGEWQLCSYTCGGGSQSRKVQCKQLLTDGSSVSLPDELCLDQKPQLQQSCGNVDCPPHLALGKWSKCSVSCGEGIQRRDWVCRKLTAVRHQVTVPHALCSEPSRPPVVQTCTMPACDKVRKDKKTNVSQKQAIRDPQILGIHRVYIQTRQDKRIHFNIGGRAYLLPKTSIVIRCPVRRFQKSLIKWEKDGHHLQYTKQIRITKSGSLKIHSLEAKDIGVYSCIAGTTRDTFVLKLIGNDNRLIEPPTFTKAKTRQSIGPEKMSHNESNRLEDKWTQISKMWQSWSKKNELYVDDSQTSDQVFLHLLGNHLFSKRKANFAELFDSQELYNKHPESSISQGAYSMDTRQFEEILRNISLRIESGEIPEDFASQLMHQLAAEVSRPQPTVEKWKASPDDNASNSKLLDKAPNTSEASVNKDIHQQRKKQKPPIILRKKQAPVLPQKNVSVAVGTLAYLTDKTSCITLVCESIGDPEPEVSWTKDGTPVKFNKRILLLNSARLQVQNVTRQDAGLYGCTVTNELGTDTETSLLLYSEAPAIKFSRESIINLTMWHITAVVGSDLLARLGATIIINCPVEGVPEPKIIWQKKDGLLGNNSVQLQNGSLALMNTTLANQGMYTCTVTNEIGQATMSTVIKLTESGPAPQTVGFHQTRGRKRVLMASKIGTPITVKQGDVLRMGCPTVARDKMTISWYFKNESIHSVPGLEYKVLARGRVLEVKMAFERLEGQYKCQASNKIRTVSAYVNVSFVDFMWVPGDWAACSTTCGNVGTHYRTLLCLNTNGIEVNESACYELPKPPLVIESCNTQDCPARWVTTTASECSVSCGKGVRQLRVRCEQLTANGTLRILPPAFCAEEEEQPPNEEDCLLQSCAVWESPAWAECSGRCVGHSVAVQHRQVACRYTNGTSAAKSACEKTERPASARRCKSDRCNVRWRTGPWRQCAASCGSGFQSRRVACIHNKNNKAVADQYCGWQRRPITWQHCNLTSCDTSDGECMDTMRYCALVKRLMLCHLNTYKQRCCDSCRML